MLILYCRNCQSFVSEDQLAKGIGKRIDEKTVLCAKCAPPPSMRKSGTVQLEPKTKASSSNSKMAAVPSPKKASASNAGMAAVQTPRKASASNSVLPSVKVEPADGASRISHARMQPASRGSARMKAEKPPAAPPAGDRHAPANHSAPKAHTNKLAIAALAGGVFLLLVGGLVFMSRKNQAEREQVEKPGPIVATGAPKISGTTNVDALREAPIEKKVMPGPGMLSQSTTEPPKNASAPVALPDLPQDRAQPQSTPAEAAPPAPVSATVTATPQPAAPAPAPRADGAIEMAFLDDALPAGAVQKEYWKWHSAPDPVFSGKLSHSNDPAGNEVRQHFFENANPPLKITPRDTLFAYVYIDPKNPPRTLMLQISNNNFEHRAIWGEDSIPWGQPNTPAHVVIGPLPKAGEWVRLEINPAVIGFTAPQSNIDGVAFTQNSGTVYWDKFGILTIPPSPLEALAAKAPSKSLQSDGMNFNPALVLRLQQAIPKGAAPRTKLLLIGAGLPGKEGDFKTIDAAYTCMCPKDLIGAAAGPGQLLVNLPAFLEKEKPEIVVIFGESAPARKLSPIERLDWQDVGRLCLRYGALPVLGIPVSTGKDENLELRAAMQRGVDEYPLPAVEIKSGESVNARLKIMVSLLQKHVLGRQKAEKAGGGVDTE